MNHESLYKRTNAISRAQSKNNVKTINLERTIKRSDIHFARRKIEILSPTCSKKTNNDKNVAISENKENILKKLNKQEEYAKRFMAWKAEKCRREAEKKKTEIKKPFYTAVSSYNLKHIKEAKNTVPSRKGKTVAAEKKKIIPKPIQRFAAPLPLPNIGVVNPIKHDNNPPNKGVQENKNKNINNDNKPTKLYKTEKPKIKLTQMSRKTNGNILKEKPNCNNNAQAMNVKTMKKCVNESNASGIVGDAPLEFLVSTVKKPSRMDMFFPEEDDTISPIEVLSSPNNENNSSARKRKRSHLKVNDKDINNKIKSPFGKKKFDFHAVPKTLKVEDKANSLIKRVEETTPNTNEHKVKKIHLSDPCTPLKVESDNRNEKENTCNYLSPYVRLSRGKGSVKKEKEKRKSFYETNCNTPKETASDRQTRESIKYFRKMLQDETQRLKGLCSLWEDYKNDNEQLLEENGEDMINASIGQTRLLLRKKFQQFDDLINRCENCIGVKETDIGNKEQRVYSDDLEGFWAIIKYQIDNIDKRFDNLNKWKANDWNDPQEVKEIEKKVLSLPQIPKSKKHKIKNRAHNALLEVLRKTQAAYKKNKELNPNVDNDVIFMPGKEAEPIKKNNNTQFNNTNTEDIESQTTNDLPFFSNQTYFEETTEKRSFASLIQLETTDIKGELKKTLTNNLPSCSIKTKKEKREARTSSDFTNFVTPLNTPRKSVRLSVKKNYTEEAGLTPSKLMSPWIRKNCVSCSPKPNKSILKSNRLHSPRARKSILKTPGSVKLSHRSVLFSDQIDMKSPGSASDSENSFNGQHSIRLRNRRILKREILEIP